MGKKKKTEPKTRRKPQRSANAAVLVRLKSEEKAYLLQGAEKEAEELSKITPRTRLALSRYVIEAAMERTQMRLGESFVEFQAREKEPAGPPAAPERPVETADSGSETEQ